MPPDYGASLALRDLSKRYGSHGAVSGISLDVRPGEFVTFLGPSGSGKTTTLNMIAGFVSPDAGEIHMDGEPIARLPAYRRNIGMVFQHYALFPHMTVNDNIAFPLQQRRIARPERARRVAEAVRLVALEGLERRYPHELSGGQQQRVAVARAVVFAPRVLLMDEPLGALDKMLRESLQYEVRRLHRELGITFIYVTHDQSEALTLSDRIAVFNGGQLEQVGAGEDLYERPETVFVADFLGESNHFPGRVEHRDGLYVGIGGGRRVAVPGLSAAQHGTEGVVIVRPERVRLYARDVEAAGGENRVAGVVEECVYLGAAVRVAVNTGGKRPCIVRQDRMAPSVYRGDEVWLAWLPQDAIWIANKGASDDGGSYEGAPDSIGM